MKTTKKLFAYLLAFTLAFSCFVCVPMSASAASITVNSAADLTAALANTSYDHIIIGSAISPSAALTINRDLTLEGAAGVGGYHINGVNLGITGGNVVLKNLKITRDADTVTIKNTTNVTISGGEIYCTHTGSGNEGAIYVNALNGTVTLTDGVVLKSKNWAVYDDNTSSGGYKGTVNFVDCTVQKVSGGSQKDLLTQRNSTTFNIGGGTDGQQAVFQQSGGKIWTTGGNGPHLNVYDGAVFTLPTTDYGFYVNHSSTAVNISGGEFNFGGPAIVINDSGSNTTISGGTFNGTGNCERIIQKNNGALTINGGEFNNPNGAGVYSATDKPNGALNVNGGTFTTAGPAISISGNITANITDGTFTSTGTADDYGTGVITAKSATTLTISGGSFTQSGDNAHSVLDINSGANTCILNLNNGTYTHENNGPALYTATGADSANITVKGGTFVTDYPFNFNGKGAYNFKDMTLSTSKGCIFTLADGVFVNLDNTTVTASGRANAAMGSSAARIMALNGSTVTGKTGDVTVVDEAQKAFSVGGVDYKTLEEALTAAQNGDTITLIDSINGDLVFETNKTLTFENAGNTINGIIVVSTGNITFNDVDAKSIRMRGDAVVTYNGGSLNAGSDNAIELLDGFTGNLTVTGDAYIAATGYAYREFPGSNGTVNFVNCSLNDSNGDLSKIEGDNTVNIGTADGSGTVVINGSGDVFWWASSCKTDINVYEGVTFNGGKPFNIANGSDINVNVYGGTFKATSGVYTFDIRVPSNVNISGGTFTAQSGNVSSYIYVNNANCRDASINITGGTFDAGKVNSGDALFNVAGNVKNTTLSISNLSITRSSGGPIVRFDADSGTLNLTNDTFVQNGTGPVIRVTDGNGKVVNLDGCKLTAAEVAALLSVADESILTVNVVGDKNTTITSKFNNALNTTGNVIINDADNKLVISEANLDGSAKIFTLAGKKTDDYPGVDKTIHIESNKTYTYSINYRATGGAVPYITVETKSEAGAWSAVAVTNDTGSVRTYTFTTGALAADGNFRIRLGRQDKAAIGANGSMYYSAVSLKAAGDNTELIENGDFSQGTSGWNFINNALNACTKVAFIPYVEGFFDDAALAQTSMNTAMVIKGGDRHELQFKVALEAGATYKFSYNYRSYGDEPYFNVSGDGIVVSNEVSDNAQFKKTYTVTNTSEETKRVRFFFRMGPNATDTVFYVTNLQLYKVEGGATVGANMLADLSPVFGTAENIHLNQDDGDAVSRLIGHGWLGNFKSDSNTPTNVNSGSSSYTDVIEVSANFFDRQSQAQILGNIKRVILGLSDDTLNPYYDVTRNGEINVLDLIRQKKTAAGLFGAEFKATALKSEIMAETATPTTGTVYYVANSGSDSKSGTSQANALKTISVANAKAKAGDTILLKRGDTWRVSAGTDDSIALKTGVNYGAYGTGAKPEILGSVKNWATATWTNVGGNVWSVSYYSNGYSSSTLHSRNAPGNVYFVKKGQTEVVPGVGIKNSAYLTKASELTCEGEFASQHATAFTKGGSSGEVGAGKVYIYCEGNPSTVYDRIEIAESRDVLALASNVTVNNIAVKFAGEHGMNGSNVSNVKITYCEVGYIGGAWNSTAPMGNGIQFGQGGSNIEASHNYVYQCYDAGITYQKWDGTGEFKNVKFQNNLLTNNFDNFEIWSHDNGLMQNIVISDNIMRDAGYCWSWGQRFNTGNIEMFATNIYGGRDAYNTNSGNSLSITNNIFDNTRANHVCWFWGNIEGNDHATYEYLTVSGNTFYQRSGAFDQYSMYYGDVKSAAVASSQAGLEKAVARFDANPNGVYWIEAVA